MGLIDKLALGKFALTLGYSDKLWFETEDLSYVSCYIHH